MSACPCAMCTAYAAGGSYSFAAAAVFDHHVGDLVAACTKEAPNHSEALEQWVHRELHRWNGSRSSEPVARYLERIARDVHRVCFSSSAPWKVFVRDDAKELFIAHRARIERVFWEFPAADREDAVGEVFTRVSQYLGTPRGLLDPPVGWLVRIATRVRVEMRDRAGRRGEKEVLGALEFEEASSEQRLIPGFEDAVDERADFEAWVDQLLNRFGLDTTPQLAGHTPKSDSWFEVCHFLHAQVVPGGRLIGPGRLNQGVAYCLGTLVALRATSGGSDEVRYAGLLATVQQILGVETTRKDRLLRRGAISLLRKYGPSVEAGRKGTQL